MIEVLVRRVPEGAYKVSRDLAVMRLTPSPASSEDETDGDNGSEAAAYDIEIAIQREGDDVIVASLEDVDRRRGLWKVIGLAFDATEVESARWVG